MPKLIIKLDICKESTDYIKDTQARLTESNLVKNPFSGSFELKDNLIHCDLKPIYPNISWIAIFFITVPILFFRFAYWILLFNIPFLLFAFLNTKYGFYFAIKRGLRKAGYKGKIKLIRR